MIKLNDHTFVFHLPVMLQKLPDFAVGVAQIYSTDEAWGVQVSEVSDVCCIFRYLLWGRKERMSHSRDCVKMWYQKYLQLLLQNVVLRIESELLEENVIKKHLPLY